MGWIVVQLKAEAVLDEVTCQGVVSMLGAGDGQDLMNRVQEFNRKVSLGDKAGSALLQSLHCQGLGTLTCHKDDGHRRVLPSHLRDKLQTIQLRHQEIRDNQV